MKMKFKLGASYGPLDEQDKRTELFVVISSCYCSYIFWPDFIEGTVGYTGNCLDVVGYTKMC